MILRAQDIGLVTGFKATTESEAIPLSQYADDTLLFLDAKKESVENGRACLLWFEVVAGLSINIEKTKFFRIGDCEGCDQQVREWGCEWAEFPTFYLG